MRWIRAVAKIPEVVDVQVVDPGHLLVTLDGERTRLTVHRHTRNPRPHELEDLAPSAGNTDIYVAPRLSSTVRRRLEQVGWSWADDTAAAIHAPAAGWRRTTDRRDARPGSGLPSLRPQRSARATALTDAGAERVARSDLAVLRLLLTSPGRWTQTALAERIGVSQPAVSKALRRLRSRDLVDGRGQLIDAPRALEWWLARYPGPDGIETHWYGLDGPWRTTVALQAATVALVAVSGPVAADVLAPWLPPDRAVLYAAIGSKPKSVGVVPVDSAEDAIATVVVTGDRDVFWHHPDANTVAPDGTRIRLADPLQVLWDVARLPTDSPDRRDESALRLADWVLARAAA